MAEKIGKTICELYGLKMTVTAVPGARDATCRGGHVPVTGRVGQEG